MMNNNITNNELKFYSSLLQKKNRRVNNLFIAEGIKLVNEVIASHYRITAVLTTDNFLSGNKQLFSGKIKAGTEIKIVKEKDFHKLSDTKNPQPVIAVCEIPETKSFHTNVKSIIACENISDPGNLGTIIRNCDWFGFENILLSEECAEIYNPKVLRSSMGSVFHCTTKISTNFITEIKKLQREGFRILIADLDGTDLYEINSSEKTVFVLCNEANGPSEEIRKLSDGKVTIPKYGNAESLNVASASAVILSHLARNK